MNQRFIEGRTSWGRTLTLFLLTLTILVWTFPSFAQVSAPGDDPPPKSNQQEKEDSESEDSVENNPVKKTDDAGEVEQPSPSESVSGEDGQNPSGDNQPKANASPASITGQVPQPVPPPVTTLAIPTPDASIRAMDIKRDRGDLPALGKLVDVKNQLPDSTPPSDYSEDILKLIAALNESSHAKDNENLVGILLENVPTGGSLSALKLGETADLILTDYFLSDVFHPSANFTQDILSGNDFAADVTSVWDHLSPDAFPAASYSAVAGRDLSLSEGTYSYESLLGAGDDTFLLAATSGLSYSGSVSFSGSGSRVVLIGGDDVSVASGSTLDAALADLVVASRSDWSVSDAAFAAGNKLYLRGLNDLTLTNVELSATDQVRLEALMDLSVDNVRFSSGLREVQMRATTIDLRNIDFPSSSVINLYTQKGGLDGKYPTFGTANRTYGRVNFLKKISQGGNPILDRTSFDLHGSKINISKLP